VRRTSHEIATQPDVWRSAVALARDLPPLVDSDVRVAVVGCGTSHHIARAFAAAREGAGQGETDAFAASEFPTGRRYGTTLVVSRSGTTSEVERFIASLPSDCAVVALTAVADSPIARSARRAVVLPFADESSVVQTRFPTAALAFLLTGLGQDLSAATADAEGAIDAELPVDPLDAEHWVFLGRGWTVGLAEEAALKLREAAHAWSEAYPALEYRHGPIAVAGPHSVVWPMSPLDPGLVADVKATGATGLPGGRHPLAELVLVQRVAVALAEGRGLDPDRPRHLVRSVVLDDTVTESSM
jgi:fructoselysine-6-P-deglycase FrlB-like protein